MTHGDVRWAVDKDIQRMEARRQIGIKGGYVGILGRWKGGKYIRLIEPISVACSAPPGTGKTAALVVPSIVESPDISMIVNDPKPELAEMTSGYRAEIGYVFIIDWSATDKPHEGLFYPRFNFLSSDLVPPPNTRSEEHTSELQSLMRISYAVFCLKKKKQIHIPYTNMPATHSIHTNDN